MAATAWVTKTLRPRLFLQRNQETWGEGSRSSASSAPSRVLLTGRLSACIALRLSELAAAPCVALPLAPSCSRCLQGLRPPLSTAGCFYFEVQEGISFPELISDCRDLVSLEGLRDVELGPSCGTVVPPRTQGTPWGQRRGPVLAAKGGEQHTDGEGLLGSTGRDWDSKA